jgi:membrane-bound lytic murein transglycosylase F
VRTLTAWLALALLGLVAGCKPAAPPPLPDDALVVVVYPGPTSWHDAPEGGSRGFEHDLLMRFAAHAGLPVRVVEAKDRDDLAARLAAGEGHVGVGGLYRPPDGALPPGPDGASRPLAWSAGFHPVEPVIICNSEGFRPRSWKDLAGASVAFVETARLDAVLAGVRARHPDVRFVPAAQPTTAALISQVSEGGADYALVTSLHAAVARNIYLGFEVAFSAGPRLDLAWLLPADQDKLRKRLDAFLEASRRNGLVARLADRYFGHERSVPRIDAGVFQERIRSVLPDYRKIFFEAQESTGIEWRLLAAIAYQESQWEPLATSETGVRGLMQLTEETARHLGVADRLDPRASALGAARYLRDLKSRLPARIGEPDRTWLALAAFNIGLGHLEDARVLAQKQKLNPDLWSDVKKTLPLLALPEYYEQAKLGYARGGMPVVFVDRVRGYYDVLLSQERPHQPRLRAAT